MKNVSLRSCTTNVEVHIQPKNLLAAVEEKASMLATNFIHAPLVKETAGGGKYDGKRVCGVTRG